MHRCLLLLAVLAAPIVVLAQAETTNRLPAVIVTGTRLPSEEATAPVSLSVVTREELRNLQIQDVQDALRMQPGLVVARSGQPGGQTSVLFRGANANQTLVLIDGVRVNSAFNNQFDFANLPVDNVERIEIVRGPQSTLYGSEAMGGVINIVTRRGDAGTTGSATVEAGSHNGFRAREDFATQLDRLWLAAETSYFSTDNQRPNSVNRVWNVSGRATVPFSGQFSASVLATYTRAHAGSPGDSRLTGSAGFDPNDFLDNENTLVALTLDARPTGWWNAKLTLSHAHERAFFSGLQPNPTGFPPPWDNLPDFTELTIVTRQQADFQNVITLGEHHRILAGVSFDHSQSEDTSTYAALDRTFDTWAGYGQYEFTPVPRFTATAGGRLDDYTTFGAHGTFRCGARWTAPLTETILRASVGTSFRAPTVRDLTPPYGNPALDPEESIGWETGIEQPLLENKLRVGATYFQNEFTDLIVSVPAPPPFYSQLVNTGRARTIGMESFAAWSPVSNIIVRGAYTWLPVADDEVAGVRLLRRPRHTGSLAVSYRFLQRFEAHALATLVGDRPDKNFGTGQRVENPGYAKLDLGLRCDVCKHFAVFGRVENALDDNYEDVYGYPALGRAFWAGGTAKF
jgi:vitamin B12 transporter